MKVFWMLIAVILWVMAPVYMISANTLATEISTDVKVPVIFYAYHLKPPLIVDVSSKQGIYYDFTRLLSKRSTRYEFRTKFLPRKRIDHLLKLQQISGGLIGVNPLWFGDKQESKYLWGPAILKDRDELVSLSKHPFEYNGPASLLGERVGGVLGYYYFGIDELVNQNKAYRINTNGERAILFMLLSGRVRAGIVSRSTYEYLVPRESWQGKFHLSAKPHDVFERRVMFPHSQQGIHQEVVNLMGNPANDNEWQSILKGYQ